MSEVESPRLYRELAPWFHLLTAPAEYAEEAAAYRSLTFEGETVEALVAVRPAE